MKLIDSSYEILNQTDDLDGIYKHIESAGRTCYKSEDKITNDSFKSFVDKMIDNGHYAMLEHGTVYLMIPALKYFTVSFYISNKYSICNKKDNIPIKSLQDIKYYTDYVYITTNYRVLVENKKLNDLEYICEPTEYHERRLTVRFVLAISTSREFIRHRVFSFAEQSTRYCNFSLDKYNNELTFVRPYWYNSKRLKQGAEECEYTPELCLMKTLQLDENNYLKMIRLKCSPQEARAILPLSLKTELVMTGFISDWKHFFDLRCSFLAKTGKPHPDASALADSLYTKYALWQNTKEHL